MEKITPTPWEAFDNCFGAHIFERQIRANGKLVASTAGESDEESAANATFICRAVNNYQELVEMLDIIYHAEFGGGLRQDWPTEAEIRTLLDKAKGGSV